MIPALSDMTTGWLGVKLWLALRFHTLMHFARAAANPALLLLILLTHLLLTSAFAYPAKSQTLNDRDPHEFIGLLFNKKSPHVDFIVPQPKAKFGDAFNARRHRYFSFALGNLLMHVFNTQSAATGCRLYVGIDDFPNFRGVLFQIEKKTDFNSCAKRLGDTFDTINLEGSLAEDVLLEAQKHALRAKNKYYQSANENNPVSVEYAIAAVNDFDGPTTWLLTFWQLEAHAVTHSELKKWAVEQSGLYDWRMVPAGSTRVEELTAFGFRTSRTAPPEFQAEETKGAGSKPKVIIGSNDDEYLFAVIKQISLKKSERDKDPLYRIYCLRHEQLISPPNSDSIRCLLRSVDGIGAWMVIIDMSRSIDAVTLEKMTFDAAVSRSSSHPRRFQALYLLKSRNLRTVH